MSRVADADFGQLEAYLSAYRVQSDLGAKVRGALLERAHRHVLASLQVWSRLESLIAAGDAQLYGVPIPAGGIAKAHLGEAFSDLVAAFCCLLHGLYKPAGMQLRSSIESFVRGVAGVSSLEACETKSVYRLFDIASADSFFIGSGSIDFNRLQQNYGELCGYVHSGTDAHRTGAYQVAQHMRQDSTKMREIVKVLEVVNRAMLSLLVRADSRLYNSYSPRVRDLLDEVLPGEVRLKALGG